MNNFQSISYFYPELILTFVILGAIIYDLFIDKNLSGRVGWVLIIGLVFVALAIHFQKDLRITTLFSDAIVLDPVSYKHLTLPTILLV